MSNFSFVIQVQIIIDLKSLFFRYCLANDRTPLADSDVNAEIAVADVQQRREINLLTTGLVNLCERDLDRVQNCLKEVL